MPFGAQVTTVSAFVVRTGNKYLKTCRYIDLLILQIAGPRLCFVLV
jgi:hypothetical protein